MREFKLLRYFQKWWWLVVLCSVLGGAAFCQYALNAQTYMAQTVLAYINTEAEQGKTPNGQDIKPNELLSSWVISQALEKAGMQESVDRVRSRISITEDIPDDVAAVQKAAWADGLEYEYFPTEYVISYNSGTGASADEARAILEAIVDSYYHYYGQKYVGAARVPVSLSSLLAISYDPLELVEALDAYVAKLTTYVTNNAEFSPNFLSALTGYSFNNLVSEYTLYQDSVVPSLYAQVIDNRVTDDRSTLSMRYQKRMSDNTLQIRNLQTRMTDIKEMIAAYVEKNQESMNYHWSQETVPDSSDVRGSNYVLGQVYEFEHGNYSNEQTTYDKLLLQYVSTNDSIEALRLDNVYCQTILDAYSSTQTVNADAKTAAVAMLDAACEKLEKLEAILSESVNEYMEYRAAQNLAITSTVNVYSTMNLKLYLLLAVVLFFFVGCIGAIVLGRGQDFIEYILYIDHGTNLPNRRRCDMVLERFSQKPVEPPFACVYIRITNIAALNATHGYGVGSRAIAAMGRIARLNAENFGFVGYNDSAQFIGVFEQCTTERAQYYLLTLKSEVDNYNAENKNAAIEYRAACAALELGEIGTARDLLRKCIAASQERSA